MTHSTSMGESTLPPLTPGPHRKRIGLISIVACLGGLLFGIHTGCQTARKVRCKPSSGS